MVTARRERRPAAATSGSGGGRTLVAACAGRATLQTRSRRLGDPVRADANGIDGVWRRRCGQRDGEAEQRLRRSVYVPGIANVRIEHARPAVTCRDGRTRTPRVDDLHAVLTSGDGARRQRGRRRVRHRLARRLDLLRCDDVGRPRTGRALPPAHDGAVRGRGAGARPVARPDPGRPAAHHGGVLRGPGSPVPPDGRRDRRVSLFYPLAFAMLVLSKGTRSPRARWCRPWSTATTSSCSRTRAWR